MLAVLSDDDPGHDKNKQAQQDGYQHGGLSAQYESYHEALYGDYGHDAHDSKHASI